MFLCATFAILMIWTGVLPGSPEPVFAAATDHDSVWFIRQENGQTPSLWLSDPTQSTEIDVPRGTGYVAFLGSTMFAVSSDRVLAYEAKGHTLKLKRQWRLDVERAITDPHWQLGCATQFNGNTWLAWAAGNHMVVGQCVDDSVATHPFPRPSEQERLSAYPQFSYRVPAFDRFGPRWVWLDRQGANIIELADGTHDRLKFPKLGVMENALPLLGATYPGWLVLGGEPGDLSSLGFFMIDAGIKRHQRSGLVMRVFYDHLRPQDRVVVLTVSQKLRSQLFSAISDSRKVQVFDFVRSDKGWGEPARVSFSLETDERSDWQQIGVWLTSDLNADGWSDLVINDGSDSLRAMTTVSGQLTDRVSRLDATPDLVFPQSKDMILVSHNDAGWTWNRFAP